MFRRGILVAGAAASLFAGSTSTVLAQSPGPGNVAVLDVSASPLSGLVESRLRDDYSLGQRARWARATPLSRLTVARGDTLMGLLIREAGLASDEAERVAAALGEVMDLRTLQPGTRLRFALMPQPQGHAKRLDSLSLMRDAGQRLVVTRNVQGGFRARAVSEPRQRWLLGLRFRVTATFRKNAEKAGIPPVIIDKAATQLARTGNAPGAIATGARVGIAFEGVGARGGIHRHTGPLLAVRVTNQGEEFGAYRFTTADGTTGYYQRDGKSVTGAISGSPLADGRVTSTFGKRRHPILGDVRMHEGIDYAAPRGTSVMASGAGRVVRVGPVRGYGNYVRIRHSPRLQTAYAHLARFARGLSVGDKVQRSEVIGTVGATGLATGPNLHYEVLRDGAPIDPQRRDTLPRRRLQSELVVTFRQRVQRLQGAMQGPSATLVAQAVDDAK